MKDLKISVNVKVDAEIFRDFAIFDTYRVKRLWRSPALFALIMTGFSVLCFCLRQRSEQAVMMGVVLAVIGIGLPIVHAANFLKSVNSQIRRLGLAVPQRVYTVTLTEDGDGIKIVTINGDKEQFSWDGVYGVHKGKGCTYLYVNKNRALFLPDRDVAGSAGSLYGLFDKKSVKKL